MSISAHHKQVRRAFSNMRQNGIRHIDIRSRHRFHLDLNIVSREMPADLDSTKQLLIRGLFIFNGKQFDGTGFFKQRQRIIDGSRCGTASIPTAHNPVELQSTLLDVRNDDERPAKNQAASFRLECCY